MLGGGGKFPLQPPVPEGQRVNAPDTVRCPTALARPGPPPARSAAGNRGTTTRPPPWRWASCWTDATASAGCFITLTFDLCEQADEVTGYDGELVDTLRAQGVKATFYAGGKWMRSHPERTLQLMADPLFELGNHAWTHGNLRVLQGAEMANQIRWTQAEYERLRDQLLALPLSLIHI